MRLWLAATATAAALSLCGAATAEAPTAPPPSIADFLAGPVIDLPELSPSGRYLAFVMNRADHGRVVVQDLETGELTVLGEAARLTVSRASPVQWLHWKTDERLIIGTASERVLNFVTGSYSQEFVTVNSVRRDGSDRVELTATAGPQARADVGLREMLTARPGAYWLDALERDPDHVLMMTLDRRQRLGVVRVNVHTGASETVLQPARDVRDYYVDRDGRVVARLRPVGSRGRRALIEGLEANGRWRTIADIRASRLRDLPEFQFIGPTSQPAQLFVRRRAEAGEGDTAAIHIFDFAAGTLGPPLWRHETYDVTGIVRDRDTDELLAGCYWADVYRCDFSDPALQAVMSGLSRFFEDQRNLAIVSQSAGGERWVLRVTGPDEPGSYYLYDFSARNVELLGNRFPRLPPERLGEMTRLDYVARDGTPLSGYLTALPGPVARPRPLIVMPHGGPEMRDAFDYDRLAQFLASRGYQVFQPNFRGSSGFGRAFAEAGYRQWGRRMQDDVTDGVAHLIATGQADPARVCIVGASYGGYAALWGGASQPELYGCVVSIAGVGDLLQMLRWERETFGDESDAYEYWVRAIGDPRRDRDELLAVSPTHQAATWRPPVLLIHGERDRVVPVEQSAAFAQALEAAGRPVRFVRVADAGHGDWTTEAETELLTELEAFLAEHLPVGGPIVETP